MGYLRRYEHDIFVSSNDWSKRLIEEAPKLVATGLGLRQAKDVDLWMDYKISGNAPLTGQLRDKVEKAGVLLVLMSEWYLKSSWCSDELGWFFDAVRQKRADRPVFVVGVRADPTIVVAGRVQGRARSSFGRVRLRYRAHHGRRQ